MRTVRRAGFPLSWAVLGVVLVAGCGGQEGDPYGATESAATTASGVDYAWARPSPSSLAAAGYKFAMRYVSYDTTGKNLTTSEANALKAAGLDIGLVWENGAQDALGGYSRGVSDARAAQSQALAVGMPAGRPLYFAIDWDVTPTQEATVAAYFDGVASVLGRSRTGAYGGYYPIKYLFDNGKIAYGWQTYAWSGGQWDSRAQLRQTLNGGACSGGCDIDQAVAADYGQWGYAASNPYTNVPGAIYFRNNKCVDVTGSSTASGTRIELWDCSGWNNQKFFLTGLGGANAIRTELGKSVSTGTCVDNSSSVLASGNPIQEWACNGTGAQTWRFISVALKHKGSMKCLDVPNGNFVNGQALQLYACNGTAAQQWTYNPADGTIRNGSSGQCIGVSGANMTSGTALVVWSCNGSNDQKWLQGSRGFRNGANTSKCLDVSANGTANGTKIQIWDCNSTDAQTFALAGPIRYGPSTGYCLDVPGDNASNGQTLQLYACNGTEAQSFTFWSPQ